MLYLCPWATAQGQCWRWPPQLGVKWPVNHRQSRTRQCLCGGVRGEGAESMCAIFNISMLLIHRALTIQCMHDQPGDYVHLGSWVPFVHWWMFRFVSMPTFACARACLCVYVQVTLKLPDQMCKSLDCAEWWVAPSLTLQTWNNAHRSLQLMSSLYSEHIERASSLPTVSIKASISGEQSFLCSCWRRTKKLDTKCKSASSTWGGSSLFVSQGGEWQVLWIRMEQA